ncbi:MAG: zinc carboxypeptidase [Erysipelotrichaceae bacterium]|nr:zinc carboxypeptidase [Erysipelotrichaceae bacterium]
MKTTFKYDHYFLFEEIKDILEYFQENYPKLFSYESICTTAKGLEVYACTIGYGENAHKKAIYIDGNTHAGEVTGSMAAMHTLDYLVTNSDDPKINKLLTDTTFYIIPRVSPDGAEKYLNSEITSHSLRSVDRPYYEDLKGLLEQDLDGDNTIRMMRIKDPHGVFKKSDKDPLIMEKRLPDDQEGEFYNVYFEGLDKDYDGNIIYPSKSPYGRDFNRNYPYGWFAEARQPGAGEYPLSNPETKAIVDFVLSHPNIGVVATHHTHGGFLLFPPGTRPSASAPKQDMEFYKEIGAMAKEECDYPCVNIFDCFMEDQSNYDSGAFDDWCYQTQGILAYTVELWDFDKLVGKTWDRTKSYTPSLEEENEVLMLRIKWLKEHYPEAIKPWTEYDHPQFGKVEIGGIGVKFTSQNPPAFLLNNEVEKMTSFTLRYAKVLPELCIENTQCTQVGDDVYKITVKVANNGYLPTNISEEAVNLKVAKEVKVKIEGEIEIIEGKAETGIGNLGGYGQIKAMMGYSAGYESLITVAPIKEVTWIIKAKKGSEVMIKACQNKAGEACTKIVL